MKRTIIALIGLLALLALPVAAQTNAPPPTAPTQENLLDFLTTGSNYWAAAGGAYSVDSKEWGATVALGYIVPGTEVISPMLRLDELGGDFYLISGQLRLQPPRQLMGKIPLIPFAMAGVGTPLGGAGPENGTAIGIVGAGAALKLDVLGDAWLWKHLDIVGDYEYWSGLNTARANQVRFGFLLKF